MSQPLIQHLLNLPYDRRQIDQGALVFAQGDPVQSLYLIETGQIHLIRHLIDGNSLALHRARAGAILAEASLFSETYHCDAVAVEPSNMIVLSKSKVHAHLSRDPELMQAWARFLAHEVQAARLRAEILALRTVAERLNAWLAVNRGEMPPKGAWKSLATQIGVSAEALYRELAKQRLDI